MSEVPLYGGGGLGEVELCVPGLRVEGLGFSIEGVGCKE